ncbi:MAG: ABC transporter ATP-binding protein [Alphaproteobacteria bacterium]|nr:ABC transporter ATP-binding protein [Alphaproteobacteria bacterium]
MTEQTQDKPALDTTTRSLVTRLWRDWMRAHLARLALSVVLMIVIAGSAAVFTLFIEAAVDLLEQRDWRRFLFMPVAIVALAIFKGIAGYAQTVVSESVALRIINRMQKAMFAHLMRADIASFHDTSTGTLMSRFTNDVAMMRDALSKSLVRLVRNSLTALALIGMMFYYDWLLALIVVGLLLIGSRPVLRIGRRMRRAATNVQLEMGEMTANLDQALAGVRLIKSYRMEAREKERANNQFDNIYRLVMKIVKGRSRTYPILETLGGISIAAILAFGGWRVISGTGTFPEFVSFLTAVVLAYQQIRPLGALNASLQEGLSAMHRSFVLLDTEPTIVDRIDARTLDTCRGAIAFEHVQFSYEDKIPALHALSFAVEPGQTVALVGPSGAGKSTILSLILRFYDPNQGCVKIDGADVRDLTLASLRAQIALVSQDVTLFDDSVAANIGFGRPDATNQDIVAAAQAAAAHEFISKLPDGYDTVVGERGANLSGGERQRIAIARAMLRDAPILLLDEATSALDAESERQVQEALDRLTRDPTTLVIAHRLATVMGADVIYVMDGGRIVEAGTHTELLAKGGLYARLSKLQFRDDPAAPDAAPDSAQDKTANVPAPA